MIKHLARLFTFILLISVVNTRAAEIKSIGVPYIQNYPKSVYNSGNQNWAVAQDKNGIMYYGNAEGLLVYDGRYWQKYGLPHRQIVRSVATDNKGNIYTGGYGEFGYWSYKNNKLAFTSLTSLIPSKAGLTDEIWKIYVDKDRVIFQSFSTIYIFHNNKITTVTAGASLLFLHQCGKRFFAEVLGKGLYELVNNKLVAIPGSEAVHGVLSILPYKGNQFLLGTMANGLYTFDGKAFSQFKTPANDFLKTYQLNNGTRILNKYYAYGTILNGLIIIDEEGRIIQQINKTSGLQNNTVLSVYADNNQNLWAGLDNGIDRIELNSPLYFYFDKTGKFGTVYSSQIFNGKIYLGTNQGLFYSNWSAQGNNYFDFKIIPNSQGQVWDLSIIDGQLLCGHNNGTFRLLGDRIEKISSLNGGWTIKKLNSAPYLIQGTYNGLALYDKDSNGKWKMLTHIEGFNDPSKHIEQDHKGDIWVSHAYRGLVKLTLSADFRKVISKKYFDEKDGLPENYNINVFNLENKLVFSSDSGFYTYDDLSNRFSKYNSLNQKLQSFATSNKIIAAGGRRYWFINRGRVALVDFTQPGKLPVQSAPFNVFNGRMVQYYENISRISNSIYLISIDDGFVIYDTNEKGQYPSTQKLPAVLIRKFDDITDKYYTISETGTTAQLLQIANSRNNVRISYTLPYYRQGRTRFQYYLDGYSKQWSDWSVATQKDFTNLNSGNYTFKVRALLDNALQTGITQLEFEILPPWYATTWAWVLYFIFAAFSLYVGKIIYERKLYRDHKMIAERLRYEQEEHRKHEAEKQERKIAKLQTDKLQAELDSKNRELSNSALSLAYKNELLQKLSDELLKIKDENGKKLPSDQINKVQKVINEGMNDERDWNLFEKSFNEAHENFFKKLKAQHPELVPNDLKLCAYLRMNMSSKELSSLLNISLRGVEIRRYRLRKKLNLPHDKNLAEFLMEL
ncbi:triple tyrosine motif-containing protein [Mucilaginibacter terrae]|uniref:Ligand-binding sensor domain-containing protein/DNA-binding CsgD family transcriptional regulator n=1 Tax=Mucilaginibacter terrae TaxID=1955052 RepID=A0ABU3GQ41_9SPHI|nr:triple tyrosine motif-containing protein [Mucilaginibacter terrae]MDT3401904.1 ligand-binding sensor domain-containing protein/DNA-binding CsgD family transcriptional regulator [Mucilaginibacter terrae]